MALPRTILIFYVKSRVPVWYTRTFHNKEKGEQCEDKLLRHRPFSKGSGQRRAPDVQPRCGERRRLKLMGKSNVSERGDHDCFSSCFKKNSRGQRNQVQVQMCIKIMSSLVTNKGGYIQHLSRTSNLRPRARSVHCALKVLGVEKSTPEPFRIPRGRLSRDD